MKDMHSSLISGPLGQLVGWLGLVHSEEIVQAFDDVSQENLEEQVFNADEEQAKTLLILYELSSTAINLSTQVGVAPLLPVSVLKGLSALHGKLAPHVPYLQDIVSGKTERDDWMKLAAQAPLLHTLEHEPEYTDADLVTVNPEYTGFAN